MKKKFVRRLKLLAGMFDPQRVELIHVAGSCTGAKVEQARDAAKIDHVWISVDAGLARPVLVAVNTLSRKNLESGFDPRVRIGVFDSTPASRPTAGARPWPWFCYRDYERRNNIFYETVERPQAEAIFLEWALHSKSIEVWGAPFFRRRPGVHQVHSRARSCGVPEHLTGLDGALRFHFGREAKMVFLKFCGQE